MAVLAVGDAGTLYWRGCWSGSRSIDLHDSNATAHSRSASLPFGSNAAHSVAALHFAAGCRMGVQSAAIPGYRARTAHDSCTFSKHSDDRCSKNRSQCESGFRRIDRVWVGWVKVPIRGLWGLAERLPVSEKLPTEHRFQPLLRTARRGGRDPAAPIRKPLLSMRFSIFPNLLVTTIPCAETDPPDRQR